MWEKFGWETRWRTVWKLAYRWEQNTGSSGVFLGWICWLCLNDFFDGFATKVNFALMEEITKAFACLFPTGTCLFPTAAAIWLLVVCSLPLCYLWLACEMRMGNGLKFGFVAWLLEELIRVIRCQSFTQNMCWFMDYVKWHDKGGLRCKDGCVKWLI